MQENWLITGANRGVGQGLALRALALGKTVHATARNPAAADLPKEITVHRLDVTDPASAAALAAELGDTALEVLICNAGMLMGRGKLSDPSYDLENWTQTMLTNVAGPFFTIRALMPLLQRAKRPRIAIISSAMGSNALAKGGSYTYRASKAAVNNVASNLAVELKADGIAVGAYHPGWVQTDMGGGRADITVEQSARGLIERIEALSLATTGTYERETGEAIDH